MESNEISKDKKINIGIQILRMILSFWIVTIHSYFFKNKYSLKRHFDQKMFHVPTFMLISFFFFYHHLSKRDSHKIKRRFKRLLIPYFTWSFVYLLINNAILKVFGIKNFKRLISFKDFFFQILLCNIYYANFWYINVLLFLSLLFSIIAYIAKNNFLFFIQLIGYMTYLMHYSSIYNFFRKHNLFNRFCLSLLLEIQITPVAVIGLTFGYFNLIYYINKCSFRIIIFCILFLFCLVKFNIFQNHDGFLYQNVELNTLGAINLFIIFSSLNFESVKNKKLLSFIKLISSNTGGIYYIHSFIRRYLKYFIKSIKYGTFRGTIILYIISHFICFFGSKIFSKNSLKFLFI